MKQKLAFFIILFLGNQLFAQQLFMPLNLKKAYENGTRSADGRPGEKYWQNSADYKIAITLDPATRTLSGTETIEYVNNSPDSLRKLVFNMIQDIFKPGSARKSDLAEVDFTNGFEIKNLALDGKTIAVADPKKLQRSGTLMTIPLDRPLPPKSSIKIDLGFSFQMPATDQVGRQCRCDSTTYFVAYWYPQVAVYDDLHGWDESGHDGQAEFYGDFATYDVEISLPKNMMCWATGVWQNPSQLLDKQRLARFEEAMKSDSVVHIFTQKDLEKGGLFKKADRNVFKFKAEKVSDFAWACSDHYLWDACSVSPEKGRRTLVNAAYKTTSKDYKLVANIARSGIDLMSNYLPGYPYPYPTMTVFDGNDGMEYPMMCNDFSTGDDDPASLTFHEVSHTYFPFLMGINEKLYGWMDEGWASFHDLVLEDKYRGKTGKVRGYARIAGTEWDIPPMAAPSNETRKAYTSQTYWRPQSAYLTLLDMLGYEKFHEVQTEYINRWSYRHPMPFDFFNTYNNALKTDLNWFWKPWFFDAGYPDLTLLSAEKLGENVIVAFKNTGTLPLPVHLTIEFADGKTVEHHDGAQIWKGTTAGKTISLTLPFEGRGAVKKVTLGGPRIPDVNLKDNVLEIK